MRSSRSKASGLSLIVNGGEEAPDRQQQHQSSPKAFSSFFGRSRQRSRQDPSPSPSPAATAQSHPGVSVAETKEEDASSMHSKRSRKGLSSRHYRSLSRSLNDIASFVSREDYGMYAQDKVEEEVTPSAPVPALSIAPTSVPTKTIPRVTSRMSLASTSPHTDHISFLGWVNKRVPRKDAGWRLHRAVVRKSKLELYKSGAEVPGKFFLLDEPVPQPLAVRSPSAKTISTSHSVQSLSRLRQVTRDDAGQIIAGSVGGLCRQILLDRSSELETLIELMMDTLGHWAPADRSLKELAQQIEMLSDGSTQGQADKVITLTLDRIPSALLDRSSTEAVLSLLQSVSDPARREALQGRLADTRSSLSHIIDMSSCPELEDYDDLDGDIAKLASSGLTAEVALLIPPAYFASQLHAYHRFHLQHWSPTSDRFLFSELTRKRPRNPLVFDAQDMHFLTNIILRQLLNLDGEPIDDATRARLCWQWISVGMTLKHLGDMAGWIAVVMAVCAPAITRLRSTWSLVDDEARQLVEREWSAIMRDVAQSSKEARILAPEPGEQVGVNDVIPYFGDVLSAIRQTAKGIVDGDMVTLEPLREIDAVFRGAQNSWQVYSQREAEEDDTAMLIPAFRECFKQLNAAHYEQRDIHDRAFLKASLLAEQATIISATSTKTTRDQFGLSTALPLALVDVLPSYKLFETSDILTVHDTTARRRPPPAHAASHRDVGANATGASGLRRLNSFPPTQIPASYTTGNDHLDEITRARHSAAASSWKMLKHLQALTAMSDKAVALRNSDLILKDAASGPQQSGGRAGTGKRPQSIIVDNRKRDSTLSKRASMLQTDLDGEFMLLPMSPAVRDVLVRAGTLDALIDLAVVDVTQYEHVPGKVLSIDRDEFTRVLLGSYRSFCTPTQLIQELGRRIDCTLVAASSATSFPDWQAKGDEIDWRRAQTLATGVLKVLTCWIENYANDILASVEMAEEWDRLMSKLDMLQENFTDNAAYGVVAEERRTLMQALSRGRYSPQYRLGQSTQDLALEVYEWHRVCASPDEDAKTLVDNIDMLFAYHQQACTLEDWTRAYDVLAQQYNDPKGFLSALPDATTTTDELAISATVPMLSRMRRLSDSATILSALPTTIASLARLWQNVSAWTAQQVSDPEIPLELRVRRIELYLECISLSAERMSALDITIRRDRQSDQVRVVPSTVAEAIAHGLVSPASRQFSHAWAIVSRRAGLAEVAQDLRPLIKKPLRARTFEAGGRLVPSIGWVLERFLEISCYIPERSPDDPRLINFDKLIYIHNLLENLDLLEGGRRVDLLEQYDNPLLCLLKDEVPINQMRQMREVAARENQTAPRGTRLARPFGQLVSAELEKLKRDSRHREAIERQVRDLSRASERSRQSLAVPGGSAEGMPRKSLTRSRYGMNSLLRAVRPLSVAITGSWPSHVDGPPSCSVSDLPIDYSLSRGVKPTSTHELAGVVISVHDADTFVLQLRDMDGLDLLLQATNHAEFHTLQQQLSIAALESSAKQRSIASPPVFGAPFKPKSIAATSRLFGLPLAELVARDGAVDGVPRLAAVLMAEIERRGLDEVGIYRVSGSLNHVNALRNGLDSHGSGGVDLGAVGDVNAVAGVFKMWLRELPDPLMTHALYPDWVALADIQDVRRRTAQIRALVDRMPRDHANLFLALLRHLRRIIDNESANQMFAHNLAIVFGPNILKGGAMPSPSGAAPPSPRGGGPGGLLGSSSSAGGGNGLGGSIGSEASASAETLAQRQQNLLASTVGDLGKVQSVVRHIILAADAILQPATLDSAGTVSTVDSAVAIGSSGGDPAFDVRLTEPTDSVAAAASSMARSTHPPQLYAPTPAHADLAHGLGIRRSFSPASSADGGGADGDMDGVHDATLADMAALTLGAVDGGVLGHSDNNRGTDMTHHSDRDRDFGQHIQDDEPRPLSKEEKDELKAQALRRIEARR